MSDATLETIARALDSYQGPLVGGRIALAKHILNEIHAADCGPRVDALYARLDRYKGLIEAKDAIIEGVRTLPVFSSPEGVEDPYQRGWNDAIAAAGGAVPEPPAPGLVSVLFSEQGPFIDPESPAVPPEGE